MGFRAPSADEVYRYALRLDDRQRTLTDRFGWSLVMVGDYTPPCREFLETYCLDLCARTADRARFVFFSNLPTGEFEATARYSAFNDGGRWLGTLGAVLELVTRGRRRYDYRVEAWDDLRPRAFHPLTNENKILELTAVPGAGESLQFAQKLGIGQHVPCIVAFTDIGEPRVHVLPFAGRRVDEVYRHVRGWIDEYYRVNRDILDRWTAVEQEINQLVSECTRSLHAIRAWSESQRRDWQALRRVAELASAPPADLDELISLASGYRLPWQVGDVLHAVRQRVAELDEQDAPRRRLAELAEAMAQQTDHRKIRSKIEKLAAGRDRYPMSPATLAVLDRARAAIRQTAPKSPENLWSHQNMSLFTRATFYQARESWLSIIGNGHKKRDFTAFRATLDAQPLAEAPEKTADTVLDALAAHYGIARTDSRWSAATTAFRAHLVDALRQIRTTAPPTFSGQYVRDCLPDRNQAVAVSPEAEERWREDCLRQRDLVVQALRADVRGLAVFYQGQREAALGSLPALLEGVRAELEANLLAKAGPELAAVDVEKLAQLAAVLDGYDDAVRAIVYPHLRDPAVIPVRTLTSLSHAVDVHASVDRIEVQDLRWKSTQAIADHRTAVQEQPSAERDGRRNTPAGALAAAIDVVLSPARRAEVGHLRPHAVLTALSRAELDGVAGKLGFDTVTLTEDQARQRVLTGLGLSTDRDSLGPPTAEARAHLRKKIERGEFDAFVTYNTEDRSAVLDVCHVLRRHGVYPWLDLEQIQPGDWVQDSIQAAIRTVGAAVVFVGPQGLGRWQEAEVRAFIDRCVANQVRVLPVLLPGVAELPEDLVFLQQLSYVRFQRSVFETESLRRLIDAITRRPSGR